MPWMPCHIELIYIDLCPLQNKEKACKQVLRTLHGTQQQVIMVDVVCCNRPLNPPPPSPPPPPPPHKKKLFSSVNPAGSQDQEATVLKSCILQIQGCVHVVVTPPPPPPPFFLRLEIAPSKWLEPHSPPPPPPPPPPL